MWCCCTCSEAEEWQRFRNTLSKRLLQPRQVSHYTRELNGITDDLITHIRRTRDQGGDDQLANSLPHEMYRWSMECEYTASERALPRSPRTTARAPTRRCSVCRLAADTLFGTCAQVSAT